MLALALLLELQALGPEPETQAEAVRQPFPVANRGEKAPHADLSQKWVSTILDRPLFSATRRPAPGAVTGAASSAGVPRLSGVMVIGSQTRAIFAPLAGGKGIVAGEGGRVGAYVVQSIGAGQVTLAGPEGAIVMRPTFDAAVRSAMLPAAPAPATPAPAAELGRRSLLERIQNPAPSGTPAR